MRHHKVFTVLALFFLLAPAGTFAKEDSGVSLESVPAHPWIERGQFQQLLNFDLILSNHLARKLQVARMEIAVYDEKDQLVSCKHINNGEVNDPAGFPIGKSNLAADGFLGIYNPFFAFDLALPLHRLHYEVLLSEEGSDKKTKAELDVFPVEYQAKTDLTLPLKGRILVADGHDYFAHHRRLDLANPAVRKLISDNPTRYAQDLCIANEKGELFHGDPNKPENWFGYGAPEFATGPGTVVLAVNDIPDNKVVDGKVVEDPIVANSQDPSTGIGNAVIIDHGNDEFSLFAHMKPGSVRVKVGDKVKQGQLLGEMGLTGDGGGDPPVVHLHYQLMSAATLFKAGGLPSYFRNFRRIAGSRSVKVGKGALETGEIVETNE